MEWEFDQTVQQSAEQSTEQSTEQSQVRRRTQRRRSGPLPPWVLVFGCLLFYAFFFHIWTEDRFSLGRFLTLTVLSLAFAMLSALLGTISKRRKYQKIFALAVVIFWGVMYLTEYFILDSFHNFYTIEGMLTGAGNAGQEDFKDRTVDLVLSNFWRILLFALPIVGWFVANRFLKIRRILTRGVRRYLAVAGAVLLVVGLIFASALSPDRNRMGKEYNFTDAVHGFGLPMGFTLDLFKGGGSSEFELPDDSFVPTDPPAISSDPSGIESQSVQTDTNGETLEPIPTEPPKPTYTYQMLDLDFQSLIDNSGDDTVVNLSKYLSSRTPSMTNEMTGMFRGKNLILITCEAFSKEFIDPELTPTLYRMMTKGIQFTDYYQPAWGGTSSGEFAFLTGLVPVNGVNSILDAVGKNMSLTIGDQLRRQGYFSRAYTDYFSFDYEHQDLTLPNLGYDELLGIGNGLDFVMTDQWPYSDREMMDVVISQIDGMQPFSVYCMTCSGMGLYDTQGNQMAKDKLRQLK